MAKHPVWLDEAGLQQFFAATAAAGGEARAVGGAVRDFLMGRASGDVDIASSLLPEQTMEIAAQHGWKAIPTGIAHGTVTLVLPERTLEVTTLRRDVETDGRHAKVAYTDNFAEDAARRDFTINALSMDAGGIIQDYYHGREDIAARRVRFIGDAPTRIQEDGLRILRFFRFLATHGTPPADSDALAAIAAYATMLEQLSGERIAQEMKKLLVAPNAAYALGEMAALGLPQPLTHAGWPLPPVTGSNPWVTLLSMLVPADRATVAAYVAKRWKLSRAEREQVVFLASIQTVDMPQVKAWLRLHPRDWVRGAVELAGGDVAMQALAQQWIIPDFPVAAADLLSRGHVPGQALGAALKALEQRWEQADYTLTREQLLNLL